MANIRSRERKVCAVATVRESFKIRIKTISDFAVTLVHVALSSHSTKGAFALIRDSY